jgi:hypothetical protein
MEAFEQGWWCACCIEAFEQEEGWYDKSGDYFHALNRYRIKPEPPAPSYRPWTKEEAIGKVVRAKGSDVISTIGGARTGCAYIGFGKDISYELLLSSYEQLDGSPCGVAL